MKRYFGPFKIIQNIGAVAYKLELPIHSKIHPFFHVSLLKRHTGELPKTTPLPLPPLSKDHHPILTPLAVLDKRTITTDSQQIDQVLIQWNGTQPKDATWENIIDLEDKVVFDHERVVRI